MNIIEFSNIEDYSFFDSDNYVCIYDLIARQIDHQKIAKFNVLFSLYDRTFIDVDFSYDFGSIACHLKDLECFIESKTGRFRLDFYEKHRIVEFFFEESKLRFSLLNTNKISEEVCAIYAV